MSYQRPRVPPATAPQRQSEVLPVVASRRPRVAPATAPKQQSTVPSVVASVRSMELSVAEGLDMLWTVLTTVPLADFVKAAAVYKNLRFYPKYSALGPDASAEELRRECHQIALSVAIAEAVPSSKYSADAPPALDALELYASGYRVQLPRAAPEPGVERPARPRHFERRAPLDEQESELGLEMRWDAAYKWSNIKLLESIRGEFILLYAPYQSNNSRSQAVPVGVGKPLPESVATIRVRERAGSYSSAASSLPFQLNSGDFSIHEAEVSSSGGVARSSPSNTGVLSRATFESFSGLSPLRPFSLNGDTPPRVPDKYMSSDR